MITQEIAFFAPRSLDEVVQLLAEHGDEAKLMGGGMSLMPTMNLGLARPSVVISLNHVAGLDTIALADGQLRLGGLVRHARVASDELVARHVPLLAEAAKLIGDTQVRNRGTLGGSLAHADPAADYLPVMVVTGATIVVSSLRGSREIPAEAFFVDILTSAVEPDEVVTEVRVPIIGERDGSAYRRLARLEGSFPIVNAAAVVRSDPRSARVAIGGVAGRPVLLDVSTSVDVSGSVSLEAVSAAASAACADAFADLSGDTEYRQAMAGVYARRAVEAAAASVG
jgi:CO/xanthine dehydrogenase FAD-binding subunit